MIIFEKKVYRRILGPVYDSEIANWRILTNKEIYANVKNPPIPETISAQNLYFNIFIILLYMFRALLCSSSGGQIVLYSIWYRHCL